MSQSEFSPKEQQELYRAANDANRRTIQHRSGKPYFLDLLKRILDEYGLAERLKVAKNSGQPLRILEVGCHEGLYLHDLAAMLEERDLLTGAAIYGIDSQAANILTAEEFARQSKPPRPYLTFFQHSLSQPLAENPSLAMLGLTSFDFIFSAVGFSYTPNARQLSQRLFRDNLRPGGIFFTRTITTDLEAAHQGTLHPLLAPMMEFYIESVNRLQKGELIGTATADWVREVGAEQVEVVSQKVEANASNPTAMASLQSILLLARGMGEQMITRGLFTETALENTMEQVYREINRDTQAFYTFVSTIGVKKY